MNANLDRKDVTVTTERDIEVLNASLDGEFFGIAAYEAAMGTGLLEDGVRAVARKFQNDHEVHAERIQESIIDLGGKPVESKTWEEYAADFPPPPLTDQTEILRYAASLEKSGASASVVAVSELSSPNLVRLAARIAGVEAMHWSALLNALGEDPVPVSLIPVDDEPSL